MANYHHERDERLAANLALLQKEYASLTPWSRDQALRLSERIQIILKDDGERPLLQAGSTELVWGDEP